MTGTAMDDDFSLIGTGPLDLIIEISCSYAAIGPRSRGAAHRIPGLDEAEVMSGPLGVPTRHRKSAASTCFSHSAKPASVFRQIAKGLLLV
jgi:hypothetical protein